MNKKTKVFICGTVSLIIIAILTGLVGSTSFNSMNFQFSFSEPEIKRVGDYHSVIMENTFNFGAPGEPVLPFKPVKILIPKDVEIQNIEVVAEGKSILEGKFFIEPGQKPVPISSDVIYETPPNKTIYSSIEPFPDRKFIEKSVQRMLGTKILLLNLYPVQYVPKKGEISYFKTMKIIVHFQPISMKATAANTLSQIKYRNLQGDRERISNFVDNPGEIYTYIKKPEQKQLSVLALPSASYDYVIITSSTLESSFQPLAAWKNSSGINTSIVTTSYIYSNYAGADNQEKIRNFIIDAYNNWGIKYVLLGGDDETIPYRGLYGYVMTSSGPEEDYGIPSDLYYAALDGVWDYDNDGIYGEYGHGTGGGEVDLIAEVFVGRATVDTAAEATNFVNKVMAYETNSAYFNRGLMIGEQLNPDPLTWGGDYKDEIKVYFPSGYEIDNLYERDSTFSGSAVINAMNTGNYHLINHMGHSNHLGVMGLTRSDVDNLNNNNYFLVYTQGCLNNAFDEGTSGSSEAISEHFIYNANGAFAYIGNTRYGWYVAGSTAGSSQQFDKQFFDALFNEDIINIGKTLQDSKEDLVTSVGSTGSYRWIYFELTLLGDPTTPIILENETDKFITIHNEGYSSLSVTSISASESWVSATPTSFTVPVGSSKFVSVAVNTSGLSDGTHNANLYTYSNDPNENPITIPITLIIAYNNPPVISPNVPDITTVENSPTTLDLTPYETDIEDSGTDLDWSVSDVNTGLFNASIDLDTDVLTITPVVSVSGYDDILLNLTDSGGKSDSTTIRVTILPDTELPIISLDSPIDNLIYTDKIIIFKYNVTDDSTIANCSLIIDGSTNQTNYAVTKGMPQYFAQSLSNGIYSWSVKCTDNSSNKNEDSSEIRSLVVNISSAFILLVDDDEGSSYETYYQNALTANDYVYHNWDTNILDGPTSSEMSGYDIVIWFTSNIWGGVWQKGTLNSTETNEIKNYLNNGGNFFFSSQDYLYDFYGGLANSTNPGDFAYDYLHITNMNQDVGTDNITGLTSDEISDGIGTINLAYSFMDYSDTITPDLLADTIFNNDQNKTCAIKADNNTFGIVFFSFPFEAIESVTNRNLIMNRTINWLFNVTCSDTDGDNLCDFEDNCPSNAGPICNNGCPDTTKPSIAINSPLSQIYDYKDIWVNLSVLDNCLGSVWFNNGTANITMSDSFSILYSFDKGVHVIVAYANDTTGNLNSTNVSFSVEIPVNMSIHSPIQNETYNSSTNTVLLNVSIGEVVKYINKSLNGEAPVTLCSNCSGIIYNMTTLNEVSHTLTISVMDIFDNILSRTVNFTVVNYCTSTWDNINGSCQINDTFTIGYYYTNTCCAETGLPSDCNIPENTTGYCDYNGDGIIGNASDVDTNLENMSMVVENDTVEFKEDNNTIVEFEYNFSEDTLNLFNIVIEKQNASDTKGSIVIIGIDLTAQGKTKTVYVDDVSDTISTLCIKDAEIASISEVSSKCNGANEYYIKCPGSVNNYNCSLNGSRYKITGLHHSAIKELYVTPSDGNGGGGGGGGDATVLEQCRDRLDNDGDGLIDYPNDPGCSHPFDNDETDDICEEDWDCSEWSGCIDGVQTRKCVDWYGCGTELLKPPETQSCEIEIPVEPELIIPEEVEKEEFDFNKMIKYGSVLLIVISSIGIILGLFLKLRKGKKKRKLTKKIRKKKR